MIVVSCRYALYVLLPMEGQKGPLPDSLKQESHDESVELVYILDTIILTS
jgi:hypothetical protein